MTTTRSVSAASKLATTTMESDISGGLHADSGTKADPVTKNDLEALLIEQRDSFKADII